jgi:hypothetical protein
VPQPAARPVLVRVAQSHSHVAVSATPASTPWPVAPPPPLRGNDQSGPKPVGAARGEAESYPHLTMARPPASSSVNIPGLLGSGPSDSFGVSVSRISVRPSAGVAALNYIDHDDQQMSIANSYNPSAAPILVAASQQASTFEWTPSYPNLMQVTRE